MQINQINISYIPDEDRLLMRINSDDGSEFRFWLTRAMVNQLLHELNQSEQFIMMPDQNERIADSYVKKALAHFNQVTAVATADFSTSFVAGASCYPLGETPVLVMKLNLDCMDSIAPLVLHLQTGQIVTINLSEHLLSGLRRLVHDILKNIDWNLSFFSRKRPLFKLPESTTVH